MSEDGFAERERAAQAAWGQYSDAETMSHDFRAGYHRAWIDRSVAEDAPTWAEVNDVINDWELYDQGPSRFSRGLHVTAHLMRGGTLESYGRPDWATS